MATGTKIITIRKKETGRKWWKNSRRSENHLRWRGEDSIDQLSGLSAVQSVHNVTGRFWKKQEKDILMMGSRDIPLLLLLLLLLCPLLCMLIIQFLPSIYLANIRIRGEVCCMLWSSCRGDKVKIFVFKYSTGMWMNIVLYL